MWGVCGKKEFSQLECLKRKEIIFHLSFSIFHFSLKTCGWREAQMKNGKWWIQLEVQL